MQTLATEERSRSDALQASLPLSALAAERGFAPPPPPPPPPLPRGSREGGGRVQAAHSAARLGQLGDAISDYVEASHRCAQAQDATRAAALPHTVLAAATAEFASQRKLPIKDVEVGTSSDEIAAFLAGVVGAYEASEAIEELLQESQEVAEVAALQARPDLAPRSSNGHANGQAFQDPVHGNAHLLASKFLQRLPGREGSGSPTRRYSLGGGLATVTEEEGTRSVGNEKPASRSESSWAKAAGVLPAVGMLGKGSWKDGLMRQQTGPLRPRSAKRKSSGDGGSGKQRVILGGCAAAGFETCEVRADSAEARVQDELVQVPKMKRFPSMTAPGAEGASASPGKPGRPGSAATKLVESVERTEQHSRGTARPASAKLAKVARMTTGFQTRISMRNVGFGDEDDAQSDDEGAFDPTSLPLFFEAPPEVQAEVKAALQVLADEPALLGDVATISPSNAQLDHAISTALDSARSGWRQDARRRWRATHMAVRIVNGSRPAPPLPPPPMDGAAHLAGGQWQQASAQAFVQGEPEVANLPPGEWHIPAVDAMANKLRAAQKHVAFVKALSGLNDELDGPASDKEKAAAEAAARTSPASRGSGGSPERTSKPEPEPVPLIGDWHIPAVDTAAGTVRRLGKVARTVSDAVVLGKYQVAPEEVKAAEEAHEARRAALTRSASQPQHRPPQTLPIPWAQSYRTAPSPCPSSRSGCSAPSSATVATATAASLRGSEDAEVAARAARASRAARISAGVDAVFAAEEVEAAAAAAAADSSAFVPSPAWGVAPPSLLRRGSSHRQAPPPPLPQPVLPLPPSPTSQLPAMWATQRALGDAELALNQLPALQPARHASQSAATPHLPPRVSAPPSVRPRASGPPERPGAPPKRQPARAGAPSPHEKDAAPPMSQAAQELDDAGRRAAKLMSPFFAAPMASRPGGPVARAAAESRGKNPSVRPKCQARIRLEDLD